MESGQTGESAMSPWGFPFWETISGKWLQPGGVPKHQYLQKRQQEKRQSVANDNLKKELNVITGATTTDEMR